MSDAIDEDVKAGAKTAWAAYTQTIALVPDASVYTGSLPGSPAPPYMQLDCVPDGERQHMTNSDYFDPRKLIVKVWGLEATVKGIKEYVQTVFANSTVTIANVTVMHKLPGDERLVEDDKPYNGDTMWRLECEFHYLLARAMDAVTLTAGS